MIGPNTQVVYDLETVVTGNNEGKVYRVGSTQYVYVYNAKNLSIVHQYDLTNAYPNFNDVEVSHDESLMGLARPGWVLGCTIQNKTLKKFQPFSSLYPTVAMSWIGGNLIVPARPEDAIIKGQCKEGQYFDQVFQTCITCSSHCTICYENPDTCLVCADRYYLEGNQCLQCISGCQKCFDGKTCFQCRVSDGF